MKKGTMTTVAIVAAAAAAAWVMGRKSGAQAEANALNALAPDKLLAWKQASASSVQVLAVPLLGGTTIPA